MKAQNSFNDQGDLIIMASITPLPLSLTENLRQLGWSAFFAEQLDQDEIDAITKEASPYFLARVVRQNRDAWRIDNTVNYLNAKVLGYHHAEAALPIVGDWVMAKRVSDQQAIIVKTFIRQNQLGRSAPLKTGIVQSMVANIDHLFILSSLNHDINLQRLERYIILAQQDGIQPVIVLTKSDLIDDPLEIYLTIQTQLKSIDMAIISTLTDQGISSLYQYLKPGTTTAFLGSSGVGKTTLLNHLQQQQFETQSIRSGDDKGKHTTTYRELVKIDNQALVVDTPGMRELALSQSESALNAGFNDIDALAKQCRFRNCEHQNEPGCAVKAAIESTQLSSERWKNYLKLKREVKHFEQDADNHYQRQVQKQARKNMARRSRQRGSKWDRY